MHIMGERALILAQVFLKTPLLSSKGGSRPNFMDNFHPIPEPSKDIIRFTAVVLK